MFQYHQHCFYTVCAELDARARLALNGCVSQTAGPRSQTGLEKEIATAHISVRRWFCMKGEIVFRFKCYVMH